MLTLAEKNTFDKGLPKGRLQSSMKDEWNRIAQHCTTGLIGMQSWNFKIPRVASRNPAVADQLQRLSGDIQRHIPAAFESTDCTWCYNRRIPINPTTTWRISNQPRPSVPCLLKPLDRHHEARMIHDATSYWQHLTAVLVASPGMKNDNLQLFETCWDSKIFTRNGREIEMLLGRDDSHLPSSSFEEPDDDATGPSSHGQLATGAVAPRLPRPHCWPELQTMAPSCKNCGCRMGAKVVLGWWNRPNQTTGLQDIRDEWNNYQPMHFWGSSEDCKLRSSSFA